MKYLVILLISVIYLVNADNGDYVPRSVYFIDENGNPSAPHPINSGILNRVRRQQPGFAFPQFPQPIFNFPPIQPGQGQGSFVQSSQTLSSRFGEDEPVVTGQTQTFHSSGGKYQQTSTVLRPDGSVQTNKQSGKVKRQTDQVQSQGDETGSNQFQSQKNERPSGEQFQSQSQPGMSQTQSQGAGQLPQQPQPADRQNLPEQQPQPADRAQNFGPQGQPQGGPQGHSQGGQQGQPIHPQGQQGHPQGGPQGHPQGGQPNYPQGGQPNYPQGGQPGFQPGFGAFPFGFGGFAPGFGFPQQGFGFPQAGFGFPGGFGQPGFAGAPPQGQPGFAAGQGFENRFGEDEVPTGVVGVGQTITSQNGQFHATSSILKPDGQVVTTQHSGKFPKKN